jgi:hypothetical protein
MFVCRVSAGVRSGLTFLGVAVAFVCFGASGAGAATVSSPSAQAVLADHPISYWRFDDGSNVAADSADSNPGQYLGGFSTGQSGAFADDAAVKLDGQSGWVRVPDSPSLRTGDHFSLEIWLKRINLSTAQGPQGLFLKGYQLYLDGDGSIVLRKPGVDVITRSTVRITDATAFHHVVATKSGAAVKLYIDGIDVTGPVTNRTVTDSTGVLAIGAGANTFRGVLDDAALYNYALSQTQVANHYAAANVRLVDDDKVQCPTAHYTTIQSAVDAAASGDTIYVCDGVYPEQVTIASKSKLHLVAVTPQGAVVHSQNPFSVNGGHGFDISRFLIEGNGPGSGVGIQLNGVTANDNSIRDNLIRRVADGVFVDDGNFGDIRVNTIQQYGQYGVATFGPQNGIGASSQVSDNTLTGQPGSTGVIFFQTGALPRVSGSVFANRISGNQGENGVGILVANGAVSVIGNDVFANGTGLSLFSGGQLIQANSFNNNQHQGIIAHSSVGGARFISNDARSNGGLDCQDTSHGTGTAGTANTWTNNLGLDASPPGICSP